MSRLVDGVIGLVFSVAGMAILLAAVLLAGRRGHAAWVTRRVLIVLVLLVVASSVPAVPLGFITVYTRAYHAFTRADLPDAKIVVLLGAGTTAVPGHGAQMAILNSVSASRVLEASRVYRLLDRPLIVSSGGTRSNDNTASSAWVMRTALVALGVPAERIELDDQSFTTEDEAVLIAPRIRKLGNKPFVLITSATHMPRAEAVFRAQGTIPVPAAADDVIRPADLRAWLLPNIEGWRLSRALAHEWLGLVYYQFRGWTQRAAAGETRHEPQ